MSEPTADRTAFLRRLRAIKEYTPEPVSEQVIQDILEVGRWAGSGGNRQPSEVVVVRDQLGEVPVSTNGLLAVVSNMPIELAVPTFHPDEIKRLSELLIRHFPKR